MNRCSAVHSALLGSLLAVAASAPYAMAQPGEASSARAAAPIDLTGQWVAIVNEEWRWRMVTPPKGDYSSIQVLNAAGRSVGDQWDPATDGSCRAYGAAGLLRMPTRLRIDWDGDNVLQLLTDAGRQTRSFLFGAADQPGSADTQPSLQGVSVAAWHPALVPRGRRGPAPAANQPERGGHLAVKTTQLSPGWLRRNGVPYSDQTTLTEYFDRFPAPDGSEWLVVTTIVEDPVYLNAPFVTSSHFRRETGNGNWNPTACRADI
jgi:hypothetical protein